MRLSDGWQRFELGTWREPPTAGEPLTAREFESVLRRSPGAAVQQAGDFLVEHFGWPAMETDRGDAIQARLLELVDAGSIRVVVFTPSGTEAGDVPTDDDVEDLAQLASEDEDDYDAAVQVEDPPMFEASFSPEDPLMLESDFEVEDPVMLESDFDISPPMMMEAGVEIG